MLKLISKYQSLVGNEFLHLCRTNNYIQRSHFCTSISESESKEPTFQELLDQSPLMKFGRADGKCVVGKVVDVCNDDIYVDFGAKFEAVVKCPSNSQDEYKIGSLVRLILNKFEMTGAFLGDKQHITLNEADAVLIGKYIQPTSK